MIVVDSSGWLEYFGEGQNGAHFASTIQNSKELLVPVICLYEVFKRIAIQRGEEDALQAVALMMSGTVVDITSDVAFLAAQLSMEQHLAMADSLILACTRMYDAELWTQDEHFKGLDKVVYFEKSISG